MRQKDVIVGKEYSARVSAGRIKVLVLDKVKDYRGRTKFKLQNVRTGKELPKLRSGAALAELPKKREPIVEKVVEIVGQKSPLLPKRSGPKKVAVLTTSDIQSNWDFVSSWLKNPDQPVIGEVEDNYGETHKYGSWGKLEQALAEGYTVYVVTSRHIFNTHDQWWREKVGDAFIIQTRMSDDHTDIRRGGANDPMTMAGWKTFIREDLGLEPNTEARSWMDLQESLHAHGVKTGRDFQKAAA